MSEAVDAMPVVRFRPNKGKAYLGGHPWAYGDEIVRDRRTSAIPKGSVVRVQDAARVDVGLAALNLESSIALRELDRDPEAHIDTLWIENRIARAISLREAQFSAPHYRLCHGEGDGLPGLVIDRFASFLTIQPNTAWAEAALPDVVDTLRERLSPKGILVNRDSRGRVQEGLAGGRETVFGTIPDTVHVEGPLVALQADLSAGQKTGAYFDQFPSHARVAGLAKGKSMLDVFSHTGGFALSALAAGAQSAVLVDSSERALELALAAASDADLAERVAIRRGDAMETMRLLTEEGHRFGVVVCDPPAFAPRKAALDAGLRAYERLALRALPLVERNGFLVLCSCSHAVTPDALHAANARAFHRMRRRARLLNAGGAGVDHPVHPALPPYGYLKTLIYALD